VIAIAVQMVTKSFQGNPVTMPLVVTPPISPATCSVSRGFPPGPMVAAVGSADAVRPLENSATTGASGIVIGSAHVMPSLSPGGGIARKGGWPAHAPGERGCQKARENCVNFGN